MDFSNRHIVITGASSGIGEATARACAAAGARVILVSHEAPILDNVVQSILSDGGRAAAAEIDLANSQQIDGLLERLEKQEGPIDTLINNAGVGLGASVNDTRIEDLRFVFEVNFFAVHLLCRQALQCMAPRGFGTIINVSSAAARMGSPGVSAYSASKGAVHTYTQALRMEARPLGVHVSECLPISVRTRFFESVRGSKYQPGGIVQTPEHVASAIVSAVTKRSPPAEILPFRPIQAAFVCDALFPGLLGRILGRRYERDLHAKK